MNKVSAHNIQELLEYDQGNAISIYMPTHRHPTPPSMQEDQTRFKNNLRLAREKWAESGGEEREIAEAMSELESLSDDLEFWRHTTEGLGIFINKNEVTLLHLPIECEERVVAGQDFDVTPLLIVDGLNKPYYLLALAMHRPKIYKGDIYGITELNIDLPESPEKALNIDELHVNSRTVRSHQRGGASSPHGEGDSVEAGQDERMKYFRMIEDALSGSDGFDDKLPVLLAGTDNEVGDFRVNTRLANVLQDCYIAGNHTETPPQDLYNLARPMIHKECVEPVWQNVAERFGDMTGTGKSSTDLDEIAEAAEQGRVDTLIISTIEMTRDSVSDAIDEPVPLLRRPDDSVLERVVSTARSVASQGGIVCGMEGGRYLSENTPVAALYRY